MLQAPLTPALRVYPLTFQAHVSPPSRSRSRLHSYRRLALEFHPDKSADVEAEAKFLALAEAYAVLSDREFNRRQLRQRASTCADAPPPFLCLVRKCRDVGGSAVRCGAVQCGGGGWCPLVHQPDLRNLSTQDRSRRNETSLVKPLAPAPIPAYYCRLRVPTMPLLFFIHSFPSATPGDV